MSPPFLKGIRSFAGDYDIFVIDLWGTLHDGVTAYPGAIDALERLAAAGKQVVLLSNVPRRAVVAEKILESVGIGPHLYKLLITSGQSVHDALRAPKDAWHRRLKGPCWHIGSVRDRSIFEGVDIEVQTTPENAGFCLVTGPKLDQETVEDYQEDLQNALKLGLPMICANPDIVVPSGDALVVCAGAFASYYAENGGDVFWHGKPFIPIYCEMFDRLANAMDGSVDMSRTIAIGDGLPTDIAGAANMGIASALLVGGVHRRELKLNWRGHPKKKALAALIETAQAKPDYVLRRFAW
jgi:HAD superfamily hydrolase (TIGR01459 family)